MNSELVYTLLFYVIAAASIVMALAAASSRILLRAAVYLMAVLLLTAGLYVMLGAEFLAGVQVLVYVGGIVVLIVFAIMLTQSAAFMEDRPSRSRKILGGVAALAFFVLTAGVFLSTPFLKDSGPVVANNQQVNEVGRRLLDYGATGYVLPFEIISVLLLAAMIGGIVVARKTLPREHPLPPGGRRLEESSPASSTRGGNGPTGGDS